MVEDGPYLVDPEGRSPDPAVCPFLRRRDEAGQAAVPGPLPDPDHRCHATGRPEPQEPAWQATRCLVADHVTCARYLLGLDVPVVSRVTDRRAAGVTPAIGLSVVILVASAVASFAFVAGRGGLTLPTPPAPTGVAQASPTPGPTPTSTATLGPTASPAASASPTPTPTVAPTPVATPTPFPTGGLWRYLEPCPQGEDCVIYVVRSGNTLYSISRSFDVPMAVILAMNPQITDPAIVVVGDEIRLPPPD